MSTSDPTLLNVSIAWSLCPVGVEDLMLYTLNPKFTRLAVSCLDTTLAPIKGTRLTRDGGTFRPGVYGSRHQCHLLLSPRDIREDEDLGFALVDPFSAYQGDADHGWIVRQREVGHVGPRL